MTTFMPSETAGALSTEAIPFAPSNPSKDLPPALRQAILIRAHVDAMREKLECSQLYVEESRRHLRNLDMPRPL